MDLGDILSKEQIITDLQAADRWQAIDELMTHYVMSQQRNIHNAAIGSDAIEEKGSLVQLF